MDASCGAAISSFHNSYDTPPVHHRCCYKLQKPTTTKVQPTSNNNNDDDPDTNDDDDKQHTPNDGRETHRILDATGCDCSCSCNDDGPYVNDGDTDDDGTLSILRVSATAQQQPTTMTTMTTTTTTTVGDLKNRTPPCPPLLFRSFHVKTTEDGRQQQQQQDCHSFLLHHLAPYFQLLVGTEHVNMDMIKEEVMPVLERGCRTSDGRGMCPHISWTSMEASAAEGTVESRTISVHPQRLSSSSSNGASTTASTTTTTTKTTTTKTTTTKTTTTTLRLYYDDGAHLKGRPINTAIRNLLRRAVGGGGSTHEETSTLPEAPGNTDEAVPYRPLFVATCLW